VPPEEDSESEASEWEPGSGESGKKKRGRRRRSWVPGGELPLFLPTPSFIASTGEDESRFPLFFPWSSS